MTGLKRASTDEPDSNEAEDEHLDSQVTKRQNKNKCAATPHSDPATLAPLMAARWCRLAQARYRQRQREKFETLETEVTTLRDQVAQLRGNLNTSDKELAQARKVLASGLCSQCAAGGPAQPRLAITPADKSRGVDEGVSAATVSPEAAALWAEPAHTDVERAAGLADSDGGPRQGRAVARAARQGA